MDCLFLELIACKLCSICSLSFKQVQDIIIIIISYPIAKLAHIYIMLVSVLLIRGIKHTTPNRQVIVAIFPVIQSGLVYIIVSYETTVYIPVLTTAFVNRK